MATRQYIGARYVTKIYTNSLDPSSAEWEASVNYEPLTLVTYNYGSYLSKKTVPASVGDPASNPSYWVQTGFYNGQISSLQNQIDAINTLLGNAPLDTTAQDITDAINELHTFTSSIDSYILRYARIGVTADGVKSYATLINELRAAFDTAIDGSGDVELVGFVCPEGAFRCEIPWIINPASYTNLNFVSAEVRADQPMYDAFRARISTSNSILLRAQITNGSMTYTDMSTSIPNNGSTLYIYYRLYN